MINPLKILQKKNWWLNTNFVIIIAFGFGGFGGGLVLEIKIILLK